MENDRRHFLAAAAALGVGTVVVSPSQTRGKEQADKKKDQPEEEVSAPEDLMRDGFGLSAYGQDQLSELFVLLRELRVEAGDFTLDTDTRTS